MTGKQVKERKELDEIKKRVTLTIEERQKIMDEAVAEIHAANSDFLEQFKMPIKAFRGMYQVHILFGMIDKLVDEKIQNIVNDKIQEYLDEQNATRKRKF